MENPISTLFFEYPKNIRKGEYSFAGSYRRHHQWGGVFGKSQSKFIGTDQLDRGVCAADLLQ
jgi:hypothetical protein